MLDIRRVVLIFGLAFLPITVGQAAPPIVISIPTGNTIPWPSGAGVFSWNYTCNVTCSVNFFGINVCPAPSAGAINSVQAFTFALVDLKVGAQDVPAFFWWVQCANSGTNPPPPTAGFVLSSNNPPQFSYTGLTLESSGPITTRPSK
jgi:hypothetical protein